LAGWRVERDGIRPLGGSGFEVIHVAVEARDREVPAWDQPLLRNHEPGLVAMLCQLREGVQQLLLQAITEPGTRQPVEVTATLHPAPRVGTARKVDTALRRLLLGPRARVRYAGCHSEEGGRFFRDDNHYRIVELRADEPVPAPPGYRWSTLGEVEALLARENTLTNEVRSLLAALTMGF
jgi:oxidase EvaA